MKKYLLLVLVSLLVGCQQVSAQSKDVGGVEVTPPFQSVTVSQNNQTDVTIDILNKNDFTLNLKLSVIDFNSLNDSGGVAFLNSNSGAINKYVLSKWMKLDKSDVTLEASQKTSIKINISNDDQLSAGGHYGALLATVVNNGGNRTNYQVALNQAFSSLIFLTKTGGEKYNLNLESYHTDYSLFGLPKSVDLLFKNNGNTHITPHGVIEVTDWNNRVVRKGIINTDSSILLPETSRRVKASLASAYTSLVPGMYKVKIMYRYNSDQEYATSISSFIFIPFWPTASIVAFIILLWLGVKRRRFILQILKKQRGI